MTPPNEAGTEERVIAWFCPQCERVTPNTSNGVRAHCYGGFMPEARHEHQIMVALYPAPSAGTTERLREERDRYLNTLERVANDENYWRSGRAQRYRAFARVALEGKETRDE